MKIPHLRIIGGIVFLSILIFLALLGKDYLTLGNFRNHQIALTLFVEQHRILAVLTFSAIYFISAAVVPLGGFLALVAGFFFGTFWGTTIAMISGTLGSMTVFILTQYFFRDWVQEHYGKHLLPVEKELHTHPLSYLLFLRFLPIMPHLVINTIPAVVRMRTSTFFLATIIGTFPGTLLFVYAGRELGRISQTGEVFSTTLIVLFVLLAVLAALPLVYKKYFKQYT